MGYTGFRPYGIREYPTKKPGKELEDNNEIWAATYRDRDQKNMLENYHNSKTVYRKHYLENTMPWHYEKDYNKKTSTINAHGSNAKNSSYGFDKEGNRLPPGEFRDASEGDIPHLDGTKLLNTGTEHWRSIYQDINDAAKNRDPKGMSRTMTSGLGGNGTGGKKGYEGDAGHPDGNPSGKDDLEALLKRSQSLGKNASKTSTGFGRNSLGKNGLHRSNARTGTT